MDTTLCRTGRLLGNLVFAELEVLAQSLADEGHKGLDVCAVARRAGAVCDMHDGVDDNHSDPMVIAVKGQNDGPRAHLAEHGGSLGRDVPGHASKLGGEDRKVGKASKNVVNVDACKAIIEVATVKRGRGIAPVLESVGKGTTCAARTEVVGHCLGAAPL